MDDMPSPLVMARGLTRIHQEGDRTRTVLDDVDLDIARGESVAVLGRSGSGKSTLLNLLSGIDRPTRGRVSIGGVELTALGEGERTRLRRAQIGFVYQFFNLIPTLTVLENLLLPLELNAHAGTAAREAALPMLTAVGLAERADSFPDRLSGGEQQRVAIARALVHTPALVLADEPTGNLDHDTGARVIALLDRLVRDRGHTLVTVTHDTEVAALADRVLMLADGRLHPHRDTAV